MDLQGLMDWTKKMQDTKVLRELVRKDIRTGQAINGDLTVCNNLLGEVRKRAVLVVEHSKKAERYMNDITEYLTTLDKRGVSCPLFDSSSKLDERKDAIPTQPKHQKS